MILFIDVEYGLLNTLKDLEEYEGRPLYARYMPEDEVIVLADVPITPKRVMQWWNSEHANDPEVQLSSPPKLLRIRQLQ